MGSRSNCKTSHGANTNYNRPGELLISVEKEIVTEVEINAPPSRVWQILTDFEKYPTGNPFIKKISGIPARNESLKSTCLILGVVRWGLHILY